MMNLQQIGKIAGREAERQEVGLPGLIRLLRAYQISHKVATDYGAPTLGFITDTLAKAIEPTNRYYRETPVVFNNGGGSAPHAEIPDLMDVLFDNIPDVQFNIPDSHGKAQLDRWLKQLLWIHPYRDGNARLAWILYNWLNDTLDFPAPLPDYGW